MSIPQTAESDYYPSVSQNNNFIDSESKQELVKFNVHAKNLRTVKFNDIKSQ